MGSFAANLITTWLAGYDATGDMNETELAWSVDEKDATVFGNTARQRRGALENVESTVKGLWQSGAAGAAIDPEAFTGLASTDQVITQSADGLEGSVAYAFVARKLTYQLFGEIGELAPFELGIRSRRPPAGGGSMVRGLVAKTKGNVSGVGALGSVLNLGAPAAGQYAYAVLHVFSAGTTITVQVQSDDSAGMGSPTTRGTIGPVTARGGTWLTRVAGPLSGETHWRLNVSAITGTFQVAGMIAVDK